MPDVDYTLTAMRSKKQRYRINFTAFWLPNEISSAPQSFPLALSNKSQYNFQVQLPGSFTVELSILKITEALEYAEGIALKIIEEMSDRWLAHHDVEEARQAKIKAELAEAEELHKLEQLAKEQEKRREEVQREEQKRIVKLLEKYKDNPHSIRGAMLELD